MYLTRVDEMTGPANTLTRERLTVRDGSHRHAAVAQTAQAIASLRPFYRSASDLAGALSTSRDTVRSWRSSRPPRRPRRELVARAALMVALCREARRYMASDEQVGEWTRAPQPRLRGFTPADVILKYGRSGLDFLVDELAVLASARATGPLDMPSLDDLRQSLADALGEEALERLERMNAARRRDVTDEEIDAELVAVDQDGDPAVAKASRAALA